MKFLYEENMVTFVQILQTTLSTVINIILYVCTLRLVKYKYILEKKNVHYMHFASGYVIIKLL